MSYNKQIQDVLDKGFIETELPSKILSLAIKSSKNCILYGAAGHAKSQMVETAINGIGMKDQCFIQSFGEGMTEDRLYGGIDFKAMEDEKVLQFMPERSFLNYGVAVFEELFDAPPVVLLSLKDTLTARCLRNGAQQFKMKTISIIALTNRPPAEISELGPAAHALIERFPLQLEVRWEDYKPDRYRSMFTKVMPGAPAIMKDMLADLIGQSSSKGHFISPRSAIHALETVISAQKGGAQDDEAYDALRFIPGFEELVDGISERMERARYLSKIEKQLDAIATAIGATANTLYNSEDAQACKEIYNALLQYESTISDYEVPDDFVGRRNSLLDQVKDLIVEARERVFKYL